MRKTYLCSMFGHLLVSCLVSAVGCDGSGASNSPHMADPWSWHASLEGVPSVATEPLYDESKILDFKLTFTPEQWKMFEQIHNGSRPNKVNKADVYVHCSFEALGVKFADAACRPKGNPLSWIDETQPQFMIKFNEWDPSGRFLTLSVINLEANPGVSAPIRDRLGMWLMRQFGIKAPRVNHVRVFKNDALFGLYMNIEQVNEEFLKANFANPNGNLYSQGAHLRTNTTMPDISRLNKLNELTDKEDSGDRGQLFSEIEELVDIPQVLAETAAEVVLPTGDNWSNGSTNYYLYDNPTTGKFTIVPWDLDTVLDPEYAPATADLYSFSGASELMFSPNELLQLIYQKPEWKKAFEDDLVKVRDTVYSQLPAYAAQTCAQIRAAFMEAPNKYAEVEEFDQDCAYVNKHVADRAAYIRQQLQR